MGACGHPDRGPEAEAAVQGDQADQRRMITPFYPWGTKTQALSSLTPKFMAREQAGVVLSLGNAAGDRILVVQAA